jgi:hypothetical protein
MRLNCKKESEKKVVILTTFSKPLMKMDLEKFPDMNINFILQEWENISPIIEYMKYSQMSKNNKKDPQPMRLS